MLLKPQRVSFGLHSASLFESGNVVHAMLVAERRRSDRQQVLKGARLLVGEQLYNCLVLDESAEGALLDMGALYSLPESVVLQISGGAFRPAIRRWTAGTKVGLEYCAVPLAGAEARPGAE